MTDRSRFQRAAPLVLAAVTLSVACSGAPPRTAPSVAQNVLIVTIDTLRADHVGIYGASNVDTPNIDRLAHEGAWAVQADAQVPLTRPSHISLFSGLYPSEHGVRDNVSPTMRNDVPLLAPIFQRQGFATAAFIGSSVLDRQSGLARGFDTYSDRFAGNADQRTGDAVAAEAITWLKSPPKPNFFAWVHLYDPHAPYTPPEPYATRYAGRLYDGEVAWCDALVGRIIGALTEAGRLDNTLVVVTSDHGEALGDHGEDVHGYFIYEATLRVPLVFRGPGIKPGTRLSAVARTIDLFPTILDLAGLDSRSYSSSGRSLLAGLRGDPMQDEPSFAESLVPLLHYGWSDLRAVRDGRWKYILAPRPELYDLDADPRELRNVVDQQPARARAMRTGLEAQLREEKSTSQHNQQASGISPDLLERLGALGYVSPGGSADRKSTGADPKDRLEEYKALSGSMQQALVAMHAGRAADAVKYLQQVRARWNSAGRTPATSTRERRPFSPAAPMRGAGWARAASQRAIRPAPSALLKLSSRSFPTMRSRGCSSARPIAT
jgi:choline-sulfatase